MKKSQTSFYVAKYAGKPALDHDRIHWDRRVLRVIDVLSRERPRALLDVGCGDGIIARTLLARGAVSQASGVDIDARAVGRARKAGVDARVANVDDGRLPFAGGSFDAVLCGEVIEHVFDTDFLFQEMRRVLRPGGLLVLTTPNLSSWLSRLLLLLGYQPHLSEVGVRRNYGKPSSDPDVSGHIHLFTHRALLEALLANGFVVERVYGTRGFFGGPLGPPDALLSRFASLSVVMVAAARKRVEDTGSK